MGSSRRKARGCITSPAGELIPSLTLRESTEGPEADHLPRARFLSPKGSRRTPFARARRVEKLVEDRWRSGSHVSGLDDGPICSRICAATGDGAVVIPSVDSTTRLLPASADRSPYPAGMDEIHDVFVESAPNRERRALVFEAFDLYTRLIWTHWPTARLWVNGGFITHKESAPHDIDVVFLVPSSALAQVLQTEVDPLGLLTLLGVAADQPKMVVPRVQPFGGLIDSFYCPSDVPVAVETWRDRWSMAPTVDGSGYRTDIEKGFLEVTQ